MPACYKGGNPQSQRWVSVECAVLLSTVLPHAHWLLHWLCTLPHVSITHWHCRSYVCPACGAAPCPGDVSVLAHGQRATVGGFVVCLHGYPSSSKEFRFLLPPLLSLGLRVLAIDMPGFGDSPGARFGPRSELIAAKNGDAPCTTRPACSACCMQPPRWLLSCNKSRVSAVAPHPPPPHPLNQFKTTLPKRPPNLCRRFPAAGPADVVRDVLAYFGAERATLVGYDWGGGIALNLAIRSPKLVSALILYHR